jgi:hypothetical protein
LAKAHASVRIGSIRRMPGAARLAAGNGIVINE